MQQTFRIDTESTVYRSRPWWWARARVLALLDDDTRLARSLREVKGRP